MAKIGDLVRYLNSVGGGRISRIEGQIAYVDEDGFENPVLLRECVVVTPASTHVPMPEHEAKSPRRAGFQPAQDTAKPAASPAPKPTPAPEIFEEVPGGDRLNVVLAYEPVDIKRLSTTTFDAYLVNDSNYYLYFAYMTRPNDSREWTCRYDGIVEPGIQVFVGEVQRDDLAQMDRIAVQYVAFKRGKDFELKAPASVEMRLDTTKFFKLHCFQPNPYFDQPVIALTIVRDDVATRQLTVNAEDLEQAMRQKARADRPAKKPVQKRKSPDEPLVVDLHIEQLVDTTAGLSNSDMLNLQIDTFRRVMDENLKNHGRKIIFIHGKGDGVLRAALLKELSHRYKGHDVQDASFREYGYGATQVRLH